MNSPLVLPGSQALCAMTLRQLHERFTRETSAHKGILLKVAYGFGRSGPERADLIQEMLLQLWRAYLSFQADRAAFSTWMYRVAMNVAISAHRQRETRTEVHLSLDELGIDLAQAERFWDSRSENMRTLDRLVQELDEPSRALILLFLDGHNASEIAPILGLSVSNVSTRLGRLKLRLHERFTQETQGRT